MFFSNKPFDSELAFEVIRFTGRKCDGYEKCEYMLIHLLVLLI